MNGKIKFFNTARHFGFLISEDAEEIFFHGSNVIDGFSMLTEGSKVNFEMGEDKGRGCAVNVVVESEGD